MDWVRSPEQQELAATVRRFLRKEAPPGDTPSGADVWAVMAGQLGLPGLAIGEDYGGAGYGPVELAVVMEELGRGLYDGPYLSSVVLAAGALQHSGDEDARKRWLPGIASGELITALAMTEPGIGSDLAAMSTSARRDGDHYVVNGTKTFITNGINADLLILAVKTDPSERHRGISLMILERGMEGFERGRNLEKIGQHAQDTAELSFSDVHVPVENLLGQEGEGFRYLVSNLPQERLAIAATAVAAAEAALGWTLDYVRERQAFGQPIGSFQNTRFTLAELHGETQIARAFVDQCAQALNAGELTPEDAATAKWWCTDLQGRVVDRCLQLFGGYGYMLEYPIARAFMDARVTRIYGGANEIMKEIVGRSLGL
jgi:alkylation response protein AidB-like acyl-CoA dehydrogenase